MNIKRVLYQHLATLCVNLLSICYGIIAGWPSPAFVILQSLDTPLETGPLSIEQSSWIGSIMCLGGAAGNAMFGYLSDRIGRKKSLYLAAILQAASWAMILVASNPSHLLAARFVGGMSGGGTIVLISLFVTEIADDNIRGILGSSMVFHINFGILLAFVFGSFLSFTMAAVVSCIFPIVFMGLFLFFPETPTYLIKSGDIHGAEKSIRFYRNIDRSPKDLENSLLNAEMQKIRHLYSGETQNKDNFNNNFVWTDLNNSASRKAFVIGLLLIGLNQFCGCFAMITYTSQIFGASGSTISASTSGIIIGAIQLAGSTCSTLLVDKAGRKFLMSFSSLGTSIGLFCLGTYTYLSTLGFDMTGFGCVPITSFSIIVFAASLGILSLPFLVISELMPDKIRALGTSVCTMLLWTLAFIMLKIFPLLTDVLGLHGCMFLFAMNTLIGAVFILTVIPETKGKSTEEIMHILSGRK